jgi:hypothetical protein
MDRKTSSGHPGDCDRAKIRVGAELNHDRLARVAFPQTTLALLRSNLFGLDRLALT